MIDVLNFPIFKKIAHQTCLSKRSLVCCYTDMFKLSNHRSAVGLALRCVFRRSTFSFILLLYILSSSRVLISNVQQIGLSVNEGCFGNASKSVEPVVSLQSCFTTKLFRYKLLQVVSLQQSRFATHTKSIRYTSKVVSLQTPETQKSICYINL